MLKFIGLTAVVLASGIFGLIKAGDLKERIHLLEDYFQMVIEVKGQINYFRKPLLMLCEVEDKTEDSSAFFLIQSLRYEIAEKEAKIDEIWVQNVKSVYRQCPLYPEDIELFNYLGTFIGQTDFENQLAHFDYLEKRLEHQIEESKIIYRSRAPLYKKIGFLAGGLIALIFI